MADGRREDPSAGESPTSSSSARRAVPTRGVAASSSESPPGSSSPQAAVRLAVLHQCLGSRTTSDPVRQVDGVGYSSPAR
jgi:hypothetical protein